MIALPKLALLLLVVFVAWYAVRWFNRIATPPAVRHPTGRMGRGGARQHQAQAVEDLVSCRICGAYVAAGSRACGKPGCPRPG